jgi:murein L,D-transpeptidase YafK
MRNEPKSSKSSSASNPKQNQQILFIVLLILAALLTFELVRGRMASRKKGKDKEPTTALSDTTKKVVEKKQTTEDSIAKLYAPAVFRQEQMKQARVRDAYKTKGDTVQKLYKKAGLDPNTVNIYIRAFKKEQIVEIWGKDKEKSEFTLLRTYKFCKMSGKLGPKLKAGDNQIPEGFYKIDRYNPQSSYHLSLGLNYPNKLDKKIGDTTDLGKDIFIHGGCQTIGCIPITDDKIKELYVMAIDARVAGQKNIAVSIFPARMTDENFRSLRVQFQDEPKILKLWASMRKGYQFFENCKRLPDINLNGDGEYICKSACGGD